MTSGKDLKGVFALLFTPFSANGEAFDPESMRREIEYVLKGGVDGLVACGKAGEFEGMGLAEVERVLTTVLEQVNGRVPVGMGIISLEREQAVEAARVAARCGADFCMVKKHSHKDVRSFYLDVANQVPIMLYDDADEGPLDVDQILPLVSECERIVALKVSANIGAFASLKKQFPNIPLLCGYDIYSLMAYQTGLDGVIAGSASIMPEREVSLHRFAKAGRWDEARSLFYERMLPFVTFATPDPYAFSVCKYFLYWKGIFTSPFIRLPYLDAPDWMQQEVKVVAERLGLLEK